MNRSISLLGCLLIGVALCGCQTAQQNVPAQQIVRLGECRLRVELFGSPPATSYETIATVSINGMNIGTTYGQGNFHVFEINLAPGTYVVSVAAPGYETNTSTMTILGNENTAVLRIQMKTTNTGTGK